MEQLANVPNVFSTSLPTGIFPCNDFRFQKLPLVAGILVSSEKLQSFSSIRRGRLFVGGGACPENSSRISGVKTSTVLPWCRRANSYVVATFHPTATTTSASSQSLISFYVSSRVLLDLWTSPALHATREQTAPIDTPWSFVCVGLVVPAFRGGQWQNLSSEDLREGKIVAVKHQRVNKSVYQLWDIPQSTRPALCLRWATIRVSFFGQKHNVYSPVLLEIQICAHCFRK